MIRQRWRLARRHRLLRYVLREEGRRRVVPFAVHGVPRSGRGLFAGLAQAGLAGEPGRRGEGVPVVFALRLDVEDEGEGFWVQPEWGEDVGAALAFEEECEPEWEGAAAGWD